MSNLRYTRESFLSGIYHTRLARKGKRRRPLGIIYHLYLRKMFTATRCRHVRRQIGARYKLVADKKVPGTNLSQTCRAMAPSFTIWIRHSDDTERYRESRPRGADGRRDGSKPDFARSEPPPVVATCIGQAWPALFGPFVRWLDAGMGNLFRYEGLGGLNRVSENDVRCKHFRLTARTHPLMMSAQNRHARADPIAPNSGLSNLHI